MKPRVVALVQARLGSRRLPGKMLEELAEEPLLAHVMRRAAAAPGVDEVVLATTLEPADAALAELASELGYRWHRGSESDVLERFHDAARLFEADLVVRITGDCPLLDPWVTGEVVELALASGCDYASNVIRRTFPKGLDVETLTFDALERIERLGDSPDAREHVTWFAYRERPELFELQSLELGDDFSTADWSVDTDDDLERIRSIYERYGLGKRIRPWRELLS